MAQFLLVLAQVLLVLAHAAPHREEWGNPARLDPASNARLRQLEESVQSLVYK